MPDNLEDAQNIAYGRDASARAIDDKIRALTSNAQSGLDMAVQTPYFGTGLDRPSLGGAGMPSGIHAYQGGPHSVGPEGYSNEKIGSGEGSQAFGHGHYFAEAEPVATTYRGDAEARYRRFSGHMDPKEEFAFDIATKPNVRDWDVIQSIAQKYPNIGFDEAQAIANKAMAQRGHMHEVNINAQPEHFLDWDRPLSEQSKHVQNALSNFPSNLTGDEIHQKMFHQSRKELVNQGGGQAYSALTAKKLLESGLKGIKYLDASSRSAGEGSRNYVVFDPKDIEIMRRYARGGDVRAHHAGGGRAGVNNANDDIDTSYLGNLLRGLKSIPETAYNYLANTSYNQMGSDALDLGKNVYHDVTEHPIENLLGALPVVGSGMAAYDAYKLNDRIKQAYASGNHEDAQKLERALALSSLGALPIFGELSSVGSSAARMAEEAALHGAAETGSRAVANSVPRDAYQVAENIASNKINQALDSAKKHMFSDVSDERITSPDIGGDRGKDVRSNHKKGGRTGYATIGGVPLSEDDQIDYARNLATGNDPMADVIQNKINALSSNLNFEDVTHNPGMGGKSMLPGMAANASNQPITRSGADMMRKDPVLAANPPVLSKFGRPFHELEYTYTPKDNLVPYKEKKPEDLYNERALITPFVGDKTAGNYIVNSVMKAQLSNPSSMEGGGDFQRQLQNQGVNPAAGASRAGAVDSIWTKILNKNPDLERPLYFSHTVMGNPSGDSSHMMAQSLLRQIDPSKLDKFGIDAVNQYMGSKIKDWPGIENPQAVEALLQRNNIGDQTSILAKAMDKATPYAAGFPDVGATRFAITDPRLISADQGSSGYSLSKLDLSKTPFMVEDGHPTYPKQFPSVAGYEGGLKYQVPTKLMFSDWAKGIKEVDKNGNPITPTGIQYTLGSQMPVQQAHQEWLDNIMRHQEEHKKVWGYRKGGRTLGNNAIDNALRLATGGDADSNKPDAPITLQDLKDWKKAHPLSLNKNAMDNVFSSRQSGFEGAEPIAMPANLDELMAYLRRKHHATGGRAHFGYGGDTDSDSHPESGQTGTASAERSAEAQAQGDKRTNERGFADRSQPDAVSADVGSRAFGGDFNVGGDNYTGHEMPTGLVNYSEQRMNTPYEGSLLSATMDPSTAFGMGYGSLVGRQNTRAGAAGFLGSAMGESGAELDPSAINAGSIGMLQETGPRRIGLENTLGIDTSLKGNALRDALAGTQMAQLGYGLNEVATKPEYGLTRNAMATGTNAANVADIALENFERPTLENQIKSAPSREAYAQGIMAGRPSGATLGVGQYDAAPASFRDALMSGVKQADQQRARISGYDVGSMLANASVSDASNDPAITAARNAAIASGEMPQTNPYAGFSSEDPAEIARYNAAMNAAGPKNAYADTTLGQRVPDVTSRNPFVNVAQGASNFLTNMITPSYGINSPEYNKISQAIDIAREPREGRGGEQPYIPPTATTQAPAAPVAPYTTELGTYNQQLPSVGGMTAAQWAAANTAGDMSKVHGRIKYVNGAPMLEYYTQ